MTPIYPLPWLQFYHQLHTTLLCPPGLSSSSLASLLLSSSSHLLFLHSFFTFSHLIPLLTSLSPLPTSPPAAPETPPIPCHVHAGEVVGKRCVGHGKTEAYFFPPVDVPPYNLQLTGVKTRLGLKPETTKDQVCVGHGSEWPTT